MDQNQNQSQQNQSQNGGDNHDKHAMDTSNYAGHGHAFGAHGNGSKMPPNDAASQKGHHVPQGKGGDNPGDDMEF